MDLPLPVVVGAVSFVVTSLVVAIKVLYSHIMKSMQTLRGTIDKLMAEQDELRRYHREVLEDLLRRSMEREIQYSNWMAEMRAPARQPTPVPSTAELPPLPTRRM
jgi:hypothetical protein